MDATGLCAVTVAFIVYCSRFQTKVRVCLFNSYLKCGNMLIMLIRGFNKC